MPPTASRDRSGAVAVVDVRGFGQPQPVKRHGQRIGGDRQLRRQRREIQADQDVQFGDVLVERRKLAIGAGEGFAVGQVVAGAEYREAST